MKVVNELPANAERVKKFADVPKQVVKACSDSVRRIHNYAVGTVLDVGDGYFVILEWHQSQIKGRHKGASVFRVNEEKNQSAEKVVD